MNWTSFVFALQWSLTLLVVARVKQKINDPDYGLTNVQLAQLRGYNAEAHWIVTQDGYILGVHRIFSPKFSNEDRQPILILHGFLCSSDNFIISSPGGGLYREYGFNYDTNETSETIRLSNNLAFVLADYGYDVWLLNNRGNTYAKNHTRWNPNRDKEFWNFSMQETAFFDLPASIEYIQKVTRKEILGYIGYSEGTTVLMMLLSERPEFSEILKPIILIAPILEVHHMKSRIRVISQPVIASALKRYDGPILQQTTMLRSLLDSLCKNHGVSDMCRNVYKLMGDFDSPQINLTRIAVYNSYFPAGSSAKTGRHFIQSVVFGEIRYFDEGPIGNLRLYGKARAPKFPWTNINSTCMAVFHATDDRFNSHESLKFLYRELKVPLMDDYLVPYSLWSHLDFLVAKQVGRLVYTRIILILDRFYSGQEINKTILDHLANTPKGMIPVTKTKPRLLED